MSDAVAAAVAAAEQSVLPPRATIKVTVAPDREVLVNVPVDLGAVELINLIGYLAGPQFIQTLGRARGARSTPILVPSHVARG